MFRLQKAERHALPLFIGLCGPSGGGKTYSALRIASGIQRVSGGAIGYVDTEGGRALHYADEFDFRHMDFPPPFSSQRYQEAIDACVADGCKVVVVDSMSHEHEGPGGHLEQHEAECQRLIKAWKTNRDAVQFAAWKVPKTSRQRLLHHLMQSKVHVIVCFRAKRKLRMPTKKEKDGGQRQPIDMGWMPIAGQEFAYEMTALGVLPPGANGVPDWQTEDPGTEMVRKRPRQFLEVLADNRQLSEDMGEAMAQWAEGRPPEPSNEALELVAKLRSAATAEDLNGLAEQIRSKGFGIHDTRLLRKTFTAARGELQES